MPHDPLGQALSEAQHHLQAGDLVRAEEQFRQILSVNPRHTEALNGLGLIAHRTGHLDAAIQLLRNAVTLRPDSVIYLANLGSMLAGASRHDEAVEMLERAALADPRSAAVQLNLGNALHNAGRIDHAIDAWHRAIEINPSLGLAHQSLGQAFFARGQIDAAIDEFRKVVAADPNNADAHNELGNALFQALRLREALECFSRAVSLRPDFALAHNNAGSVYMEWGRLDEAIAARQRAIEIDPNFAGAHHNLAGSLALRGELDASIAHYRRAIDINPTDPPDPNTPILHSSLLHMLAFHPACGPTDLLRECREWDRRHAQPLRTSIAPHPNDRSPDRRLKIGYVSPDFRNHPVGRFLLPLLAAHDHEKHEIVCYSSASPAGADDVTARLRAHADLWRDAFALDHAQLAEQIRADRIDILVDLTMHMANNRLLVFARKPAPVQVTYLAYCGTTGLGTVDYRLSDPFLDPVDADESLYSEKTIRLPETYWCYPAPDRSPDVTPPPLLERGFVTFCSLNNFAKCSPAALTAWRELMRSVPNSRLIIHAHEGSHRQRVQGFFADAGVSSERIEFVSYLATADYFKLYEKIDIALDPFPYAGGTTTCDALWMGVPVVTLAGKTAFGRGGVSILSNLGLTDLIAQSETDYLRIASELAHDPSRLRDLRHSLRPRMQASPLMNAPRFARSVETAYRTMWHAWCRSSPPGLS